MEQHTHTLKKKNKQTNKKHLKNKKFDFLVEY